MNDTLPRRRSTWLPAALLALAMSLRPLSAAEFDQGHERYAKVLRTFVKSSLVDYAGLKAEPGDLDAYLREIAEVPSAEFAQWSEADRLALLLNLYNAQTLRLIANRYPVKGIRSIGVLPGAAWRELIVRHDGQLMTLAHLENNIIRRQFREPRIHFALVCAALGCPPLRDEPYVGARLDRQLEEQARQFLGSAEKNRFEAAKETLHLSPIFKWYADDFTKPAGSLAAYVKPFLPDAQRNAMGDPAKVKVRFTDYDLALNEQKP